MVNTPTNLSVTDASTEDELTLDWDAVSDATGYYVYRAQASGSTASDYTQIDEVLSSSYTDTGLEDGEQYFYRVSANDDRVLDGLVAWYRFEDSAQTAIDATAALGVGADQTPHDLSVNGPSFTQNGGVTDTLSGTQSGAYEFDGNDDVMDGATIPTTGSKPRTVTASIKTTSNGTIADWGVNNTGERWTFVIFNGDNIRIESSGDGYNGNITVTDGQYHHVAVTYDGSGSLSGSKLFVDGQLDVAGGVSNPVDTANGDLRIGEDPFGRYWDGRMDDVRIYNRELSQSEIQTIHGNTIP
jgi:fibronectin type 3 domain-containing protein